MKLALATVAVAAAVDVVVVAAAAVAVGEVSFQEEQMPPMRTQWVTSTASYWANLTLPHEGWQLYCRDYYCSCFCSLEMEDDVVGDDHKMSPEKKKD